MFQTFYRPRQPELAFQPLEVVKAFFVSVFVFGPLALMSVICWGQA